MLGRLVVILGILFPHLNNALFISRENSVPGYLYQLEQINNKHNTDSQNSLSLPEESDYEYERYNPYKLLQQGLPPRSQQQQHHHYYKSPPQYEDDFRDYETSMTSRTGSAVTVTSRDGSAGVGGPAALRDRSAVQADLMASRSDSAVPSGALSFTRQRRLYLPIRINRQYYYPKYRRTAQRGNSGIGLSITNSLDVLRRRWQERVGPKNPTITNDNRGPLANPQADFLNKIG